ncbi:MAG: hypothetical protein MR440_06570, partial [Firmicutes bacterium]|nr:hypothetical protein [Bacillota bacterium]
MQPAQAKPVMQPASPRPAEPVQTIQTSENKENEMLWHQVFEEGEDEAGSFNLIRKGTRLYHLGDKNFTVLANNDFTKKFTEQKRDLIERIMADKLGHPVQMVCCLEPEIDRKQETAADETKEDDSELARKASEILGIEVEID